MSKSVTAVAAIVGTTTNGYSISEEDISSMVSLFKEVPVLDNFDDTTCLGHCTHAALVEGRLEVSLKLNEAGQKHMGCFAAAGYHTDPPRLFTVGVTHEHAQKDVPPFRGAEGVLYV